MVDGRYFAFSPWKSSQFVGIGWQSVRAQWRRMFSWATKCTVSGNSVFEPLWSKWTWVLMMVVTGLSVSRRTCPRMSAP